MKHRLCGGAQILQIVLAVLLLVPLHAPAQTEMLASWNDGSTKQAIVAFVARTTTPGSPDFVTPAERIATFANDGTLWSEQPISNQFAFMIDRVEELAPEHPAWQVSQPFKAALDNDHRVLAEYGERGLAQMMMATHAGMSTDEFAGIVSGWLSSARHPRIDRPYTDLVYQPMLELIAYLRKNGFKTYIVADGTVEFMRPWSEAVYGVPPQQVIGTTFITRFQLSQEGKPVLMQEPKMEFVDDGPGKPVAIHKFIGRRPIFAFGSSDDDLQMLQWTSAGPGVSFMGLVHHTDGEREWAYDRESPVGKLDKALDEAREKGWTVVDMKKDWKTIFPFSVEKKERPR